LGPKEQGKIKNDWKLRGRIESSWLKHRKQVGAVSLEKRKDWEASLHSCLALWKKIEKNPFDFFLGASTVWERTSSTPPNLKTNGLHNRDRGGYQGDKTGSEDLTTVHTLKGGVRVRRKVREDRGGAIFPENFSSRRGRL